MWLDAPSQRQVGIGMCGGRGRGLPTRTRAKSFSYRFATTQTDDRSTTVKSSRRLVHVETDVGQAFGHHSCDRRRHVGVVAPDSSRTASASIASAGQTEQLKARAALSRDRAARHMSRVNTLELLTAGGTNLHELLGSGQLLLMRLELGACRDVARLGLGQLGAEDLRERLAALNVLRPVRPPRVSSGR